MSGNRPERPNNDCRLSANLTSALPAERLFNDGRKFMKVSTMRLRTMYAAVLAATLPLSAAAAGQVDALQRPLGSSKKTEKNRTLSRLQRIGFHTAHIA
jgi:hypothetical protein